MNKIVLQPDSCHCARVSDIGGAYLSGFRLAIKVAIIGASFSFIELEVAISS